MKYTAELTIFDERNGEPIGTFNTVEIEEGYLTSDAIEALEDFVSNAISTYEEDVYGL